MDQYKTCTKCGQTKSFSEFTKDKHTKLGITSACCKCRNAFRKERLAASPELLEKSRAAVRAFYHKNKERAALANKNWAKSNPEKRKRIDAKFREAHREDQRKRMVVYRQNNPDQRRLWAKANPIKQAAIYARRSFARRGGVRFAITLNELQNLYRNPCLYCGAPSEHIDHIVPLSRGGRHSIGNLTGSCAPCNLSKGAKFITEWKKGKNAN
jgi:5-methylcytosine-specific restriction endonuclease McrA